MNPSAWFQDHRRDPADDDKSTLAALVIAILFAVLALASFAVDQSISLPSQPTPARVLQAPR
jgi:hypothetical protein